MPTIKNICPVSGCKHVQPCPIHSKKEYRGTAKERGYDNIWVRCRNLYLSVHPLCECGCGRPAQMVHHILPLKDYPKLKLEWMNLLALTNKCHALIEDMGVVIRIERGKILKEKSCMGCIFLTDNNCTYGVL